MPNSRPCYAVAPVVVFNPNHMNRPSSIRDLARATGLGKSTVAKALAGLPGVAAETCALVRCAAEAAGYRRDPLVADLAARRWRSRANAAPLPLAYVSDLTETTGLQVEHESVFVAAQAAAIKHGYHLEAFDLADYPSHARASQVLWTRGYRGLLIGRIMRQHAPIEIEWERFTAVACGLGLTRPPVHLVDQNSFSATRYACETALKRGYRRPGYVHCVHYEDEPECSAKVGGFLFASRHLPVKNKLPVCTCAFDDSTGFRAWLREWCPDVIIGFNNIGHWWIRGAGMRLPKDVAFISLATDVTAKEGRTITGAIWRPDALANAGVELLVSQIHLNARGIPDPVQTVYIEPHWNEGKSLPDRLIVRAGGKVRKPQVSDPPPPEFSFPGEMRHMQT